MNNEELTAQVSALDLKPGTVVVLRLQQGTPATLARQMGEEIQKHIPFGTQIFVLPSGEDIEALDEAQMRELGWVKWEKVEPLVVCAEHLEILLREKAKHTADNDEGDFESLGLLRHADNVRAIVDHAKGTQTELVGVDHGA